jgi:prepilin-type N-terminal cleavage/methylation domain-containing protein
VVRRSARGFTLIELLVVICIIGILTGLVTVGITAALNASKANSSEVMLQSISAALATYQTRWGDYPPTSLSEIGGGGLNDANNGAEALVACLASSRRGPKLYDPPALEQYVNTDGDSASSNITGWYFGDNALREYSDFFGNVIVYMHHRDYARPRNGILVYVLSEGGERVKVEAEKSPQTKAFVNPDKYQVRSVGRDGIPGTGDDLRAGGN